MNYVLYWAEHLRDGKEEGAKVVPTIDAGLALINRLGLANHNHTFQLFELGAEVPLKIVTIEVPQPPIVKKTVVALPKE